MPTRRSKASKGTKPEREGADEARERVQWPLLRPVLPSYALSLDVLLRTQLVVIPRLLCDELCSTLVRFCTQSLKLETTPGTPKRGEAVRVNDRFQVLDEAFAARLWDETGLRDLLAREEEQGELWTEEERAKGTKAWGLNANIRVYRYGKGQFFDKHYDDDNVVLAGGKRRRTIYTLLIYLTGSKDGLRGGDTVFYPSEQNVGDGIAVAPEKGLAVLHRHGAACMLHEGKEVTSGEKWVLRSDVVLE